MGVLLGFARGLAAFNSRLLTFCLWIGGVAVALMVAAILLQVFYRYVLGNALPWPEEMARFLMLWMTGLMAPVAYRRGGFVGIDLVVRLLPAALAAVLSLVLLGVALAILSKAFAIGTSELCGFVARSPLEAFFVPDTGIRFDLAALCKSPGLSALPALITAWGWETPDPSGWFKVPRWWMMLSFHAGVTLMILVTVELMLRAVARMAGAGGDLPMIADETTMGAE